MATTMVVKLGQSLRRDWLLWAAVAVGLALRGANYAADHSLWHDEATLALTLSRTSYRDALGGVLPNDQAGPVAFLWLVKATAGAAGYREWGLRLPAFVAGLVTLGVGMGLCRRLLEPRAAAVGMLLFALAPPLVRYAAEAKQYGFDAMTACLLLWLATRLEESDLWPRWLALAAIMGVLAPWFSHPSVFVLAGIGLSLFLEALVRRERRRVVNLAILGVVWLAGFALCYWVQMRSIARCPGLLRYWQNEFMPFPPRSQADVKWLIDHALGVFVNPAGFVTPGLAAFCFLVGAHVVGRTSLRRLGFLLLPLAPALVASALRCYPFEGRLLVFLVPALLVLIASGASELMDRIRPRAVGGAALLILMLFPCVCGVRTLAGLVRPEGLRPVLEEVRRQAAAGDAVYVYHGATPQFEFYRTRLGLAPPAVVLGQPPADAGPGYAQELGRVRGHGRVWFVFDLVSDGDKAAFPAYLDHRGRRCLEIRRPRGAWAWLYELADTPP